MAFIYRASHFIQYTLLNYDEVDHMLKSYKYQNKPAYMVLPWVYGRLLMTFQYLHNHFYLFHMQQYNPRASLVIIPSFREYLAT